jgi:hypothetical protein
MALIVLEGQKAGSQHQAASLSITADTKEEEVTQWLEEYYEHPFTSTAIGSSHHLRSLKGGFELEFAKERLETAFLYFRTAKQSCFEGVAHLGIHKGWTIKSAVCFLGEPPTKNPKLMEIIYPHLGLGLAFQGSWTQEQSLIEYCYIYPREGEWYCGGCAKKCTSPIFACLCGLVQYCSEKCYGRHYGHHVIFC